MKVIIAPNSMFALSRPCLEQLFARRKDVFDEGIDVEIMRLPGRTDAQVLAWHTTAVLRGGILYFLKEKARELRTDPELVALIEAQGSAVVQENGRDDLKLVEIPDDIDWYIRTEDDGSESIHESHRIWR
jgi:hypothetical protein